MSFVFFKDFELEIFPDVYEPAEDSFLLASSVSVKDSDLCLDMGSGSGIQSINMALQGAKVLACDISENAVENTLYNARKLGLEDRIKVFQSNLFSRVPKIKFDVIVFNPPYLPGNYYNDSTIYAGNNGHEIITKFLEESIGYLSNKSCIYLVLSSLSNLKSIFSLAKKLGFRFQMLSSKKLFFERIMVFKFFPNLVIKDDDT